MRGDVGAALAYHATRELVIRIAPHQRRQIERHAETRAAGSQQLLVTQVGVLRRPETGELPHCPELAAVAGGMNAAGIGKLARIGEVAVVVERGHAVFGVQLLNRATRNSRERTQTGDGQPLSCTVHSSEISLPGVVFRFGSGVRVRAFTRSAFGWSCLKRCVHHRVRYAYEMRTLELLCTNSGVFDVGMSVAIERRMG